LAVKKRQALSLRLQFQAAREKLHRKSQVEFNVK